MFLVQGKTEIMSTKLLDFEEVGVQKSATLLSDISSNKANKAIKAGDAITFSWKFVGIKAAQNCYHGDTLIADCVSPLTVPALDVSAAGAKATFIVEFTDVCGSMKKAQYSYTSAGVTADTAVSVLLLSCSLLELQEHCSSQNTVVDILFDLNAHGSAACLTVI